MYIKGGAGVAYGDVVSVINEVRKVGVDKIGLVAVTVPQLQPRVFRDFRFLG